LSPKCRISRNTGNQGPKDRTNTSSSTNESCCSSSSSDELTGAKDGDSDGDSLGDDAARLAACDVRGRVADQGTAHEEARVAGSGLESRDGGCGTCYGEELLAIALRGCGAIDVPDVKARRAIGFACRNVEAPLRRAERAASWAMEFMMIADGIDDGEWSLRY